MTKKNKLILICSAIAILIVGVILFLIFNNKKVTYKVIFDSNGGTSIKEQIVNEGDSVIKPNDPSREGYVFVEWRYNGILFDFSTKLDKDITLKAYWVEESLEKEMVTIKFDTDGGTTISNQIIEKGSNINKPIDPVRDGYKFLGWYYNDEIFDFTKEVDEDITIMAKWEKINIPSDNSGNSNGSSNNKPNTKPDTGSNSNSGSNTGSNSNGNNSNEETKPSTPEVKKYTVSFDSNGGSNIASQTVNEGSKVSKPENPTKEGYTFVSWTLNGNDYNFDSVVTGNITLMAKWAEIVKNSYTVTFNSDGGSNIASQTVFEGNKVAEPGAPSKEGYKFGGWLLNGSSYNFNNAVISNIVLTAKWTQKNYSVVANSVDKTAPFSRVLSVYEDGNVITVNEIQYSDGVKICSGDNPNVNYYAIEGETSLKLVLTGGTVVTASLTIN